MKFWEMLKNDARGAESKNKDIATLEERIRYTEYMALGCGGLAFLCFLAGGWFLVGTAVLGAVAFRKAWIALDKRDIV